VSFTPQLPKSLSMLMIIFHIVCQGLRLVHDEKHRGYTICRRCDIGTLNYDICLYGCACFTFACRSHLRQVLLQQAL
jgi:hypothetical protein